MIKVNLVPADILAKARQRQLVLQASLLGGVFGVLLICLSFAHWFGLSRLKQKLAEDELVLQRLSEIVKEVEELEKAAAAVRARLGVIEGLLKGRSFYPIFMSDFARTVPPGVKVAGMQTSSQGGANGVKLTVNAVANTNEDIANFVKGMEKQGRFSTVELGAISANAQQFAFSLTAQYK